MLVTGKICPASGTYQAVGHEAHPHKIWVVRGKKFPACPECHGVVTYLFAEGSEGSVVPVIRARSLSG